MNIELMLHLVELSVLEMLACTSSQIAIYQCGLYSELPTQLKALHTNTHTWSISIGRSKNIYIDRFASAGVGTGADAILSVQLFCVRFHAVCLPL